MKHIIIRILIILFAFEAKIYAQNNDSLKSDGGNPLIISANKNFIENDEVLQSLFSNSSALIDKTNKKITIVHIGDSHLQGDYLSRTIRYRLQKQFGEAGRGMIFPYSLLNMYGPVDYTTTSNVRWDNTRMFPRERKGPVGLSGYAVFTASPQMKLNVKLFEPNNRYYGALQNFSDYPSNNFNKVHLIYSNDSMALPLQIAGVSADDISGKTTKLPQYNSSSKGFQTSTVTLDGTYKKLLIEADSDRSFKNPVYIHGINFENTNSTGILYHMAGVGACQLSNFLETAYFYDQTVALQPELLIISLGANESCTRNFDTIGYAKKLRDLIAKLRKSVPNINFIITTPPDILFRGTRPPSMDPICRTLRSVAYSEKCGFWNLNQCMGGPWSNQYWFANKLVGPDRIHFSPRGYDFLGLLFTEAFFNSYNKYAKNSADTALLKESTAPYRDLFIKMKIGVHAAPAPIPVPNTTISRPNRVTRPTTPAPSRSGVFYHTVRSGESVYSISRRYRVNYKNVQRLNGFNDKTIIRPGQRIRIR